MGNLTRGKYTYGSKTITEIYALDYTILQIGDSVYDTTFKSIRRWTGNNWIGPNSSENQTFWGGTFYLGSAMEPSTGTDNRIVPSQGATRANILGITEGRFMKGELFRITDSTLNNDGTVSANNTVKLDSSYGDVSDYFRINQEVYYQASSIGNNGSYTALASEWDGSQTVITIVETTLVTGDDIAGQIAPLGYSSYQYNGKVKCLWDGVAAISIGNFLDTSTVTGTVKNSGSTGAVGLLGIALQARTVNTIGGLGTVYEISQGSANGTVVDSNTIEMTTGAGDLHLTDYSPGSIFQIINSNNGNNGNYTVDTSSFDGTRTIVNTVETTLNPGNDTGEMQDIAGGITGNNTITFSSAVGDISSQFEPGDMALIHTSSNGNDGTYEILTSVWNGSKTIITVNTIDWDSSLTNGLDTGICVAANVWMYLSGGSEKN